MNDFTSITVTKSEKSLEIHNPTSYPLIGKGAQGAVFKLSKNTCVKIFVDPDKAKMEQEAFRTAKKNSFMPKVYETGENYVVMEYLNGPCLKDYLLGSMFMPEEITKKLLQMLEGFKESKFTMIDAPLRHIFVVNNELKVIDHVNAFKRDHLVPIKLIRDLKYLLLKDSFLMQVQKLAPDTYKEWDSYLNEKINFKKMLIQPDRGDGVKVDSSFSQRLIGKGHQGAVYRLSDDLCVKVYGKINHAQQEQDVLLSCQHLSFIPKVHEAEKNYVVMEYLSGPDLNTYLKKQTRLPEEVTRNLLDILTQQKREGFKKIDAPLRHIIITKNGFKMVDHVYSFTHDQNRPLELFQDLHERGFLEAFLEQMKRLDSKTYHEWTKTPIPLTKEG
ncbi:hypothetical protein RGU12_11030 [Fredinandcohnia sp. QZ13]|uniref:hypothetical protein n=1 Tax=Fredinandcohnia sp. QZ13 TaxID=3073144 RepID=UPI0028534B00|nr:hypothetical protein [Fredinandcohnia sp. QZ13]MDR4888082.1 hypothetical protein [Fredinandcohnia sp. QZ13]